MSEYWKSTPSYWCKFCSIYVKDTGIERKNHEASTKHQNNIQRNLRELQKTKERDNREQQRAKDEVARLTGLVSGKPSGKSASPGIIGASEKSKSSAPVSAGPVLNAAAQRKAHAEQLAALGVKLPEELEREVTGVGKWHVVSERVVDEHVKQEGGIKQEADEVLNKGVRKRQIDDDEEENQGIARKAWGSKLKSYPTGGATDDTDDLDALLGGIKKKEKEEVKDEVKEEEASKPIDSIPDVNGVKKEQTEEQAPPVLFKKRKVKK